MTTQTSTFTLPILTEDVCQAVRRRDWPEVARLSPYVGCLLELLRMLGQRDPERDVVESLPHHATRLDIADIRNVLANMGYETKAISVSGGELDARLLPALFVTESGEVWTLRRLNEQGVEFYDGSRHVDRQGPLPTTGTLFVIGDLSPSDGVTRAPEGPWFSELRRRFDGLLLHLAAMTFWLNLTTIAVPLYIMAVYDQVIGVGAVASMPYLLGGIAVALLFELGYRLLRARGLGLLAGRIDYLISTATFQRLLGLPPVMVERAGLSAQIAKLQQFDSLREFFAGPAIPAFLELPFVPVLFLILIALSGWIALIPAIAAVVYLIVGAIGLGYLRRGVGRAGQARSQRENFLMESFSGLREIKALSLESVWLQRYALYASEQAHANRNVAFNQVILSTVTNTVSSLCAIATVGFGCLAVMAGEMSIGALIATMTIMGRVQGPLQGLFLTWFQLESIGIAIREINQMMRLPVERRGKKSMLLAKQVEGSVKFRRVSFRYGPDCDPSLTGVSFDIPAKSFVAVVGANGSGKSTILKLINAMYPIAAGAVYIDGIDTRQFDAGDLRRLIAYVPQHPSLFFGTIAQNLRMKDPLATDDDLRVACFKTGILRAIELLPEGFNTQVGDQASMRLPGSLINGICIARALVSSAAIVLLDEPGSGLDNDADEALMLQLQSMKGHVTMVMSSHRPSHIRLADQVIVIDGGNIVEICTPDAYYDRQKARPAPKGVTQHVH